MNTASNKTAPENIIPAEEAWRYDQIERSAMIHNGFAFEMPRNTEESNVVQVHSQERIEESTEIFRDKAGNIISAERADDLRFQFHDVDREWKENALGERVRRHYI